MIPISEKFLLKQMLQRSIRTIARDQSGFTLMELIISMIIMGIVLSFSVGIIALNGEAVKRIYTQSSGSSEIRNALRQMRADIQKMSADSILHALPDRLAFYDIDGNYINYHIINDKLLRNNQTMLDNLNQTPFVYRDADFQPISSPVNAIQFVEVTLTFSKNEQTFRYTDVFYVRN